MQKFWKWLAKYAQSKIVEIKREEFWDQETQITIPESKSNQTAVGLMGPPAQRKKSAMERFNWETAPYPEE